MYFYQYLEVAVVLKVKLLEAVTLALDAAHRPIVVPTPSNSMESTWLACGCLPHNPSPSSHPPSTTSDTLDGWSHCMRSDLRGRHAAHQQVHALYPASRSQVSCRILSTLGSHAGAGMVHNSRRMLVHSGSVAMRTQLSRECMQPPVTG